MSTTFKSAAESYARAKGLSRGSRNEYLSTIRKWERWGGGGPIEQLRRKDVREFLDWVHEQAVKDEGTNPGRTANKAREHLRAVLSWAWEQELIEALPRYPGSKDQRDVAGRHDLTKAEINALYFATHAMGRPRGWDAPLPIGRYWRPALVVFFNYGVDTGTVWESTSAHEPVLWRHVSWERHSPDREVKEVEMSPHGRQINNFLERCIQSFEPAGIILEVPSVVIFVRVFVVAGCINPRSGHAPNRIRIGHQRLPLGTGPARLFRVGSLGTGWGQRLRGLGSVYHFFQALTELGAQPISPMTSQARDKSRSA